MKFAKKTAGTCEPYSVVSKVTALLARKHGTSLRGAYLTRAVKCTALALFTALLVVSALSSRALAATDFCSGGTLDQGAPLGQVGPDLVITNMTCTVDGTKAPYNFHNVYIFGSGMQTGTLMFSNVTMQFYAANILVQNQGVLQATGIGASNGGQTLTIHLYGAQNDPGVVCKKVDNGSVVDDLTCGVPTSPSDVWNSNRMNMQFPTSCTKTSQLTPPTTLPGGVDDCFYQYGTFDSNDISGAYFGHKVLAVSYGGTINFSGYKGAQGGDDSNPAVTRQQLDASQQYSERQQQGDVVAGQRHARRLEEYRQDCSDLDGLPSWTRRRCADNRR